MRRSFSRSVLVAALPLLGACQTDVPLGQLAADASVRDVATDSGPESDAQPDTGIDTGVDTGIDAGIDAGTTDSGLADAFVRADGGVVSYVMTFSATATVACYDQLFGREAEFADLTPENVGAYGGLVEIEFGAREDGPHRISGHSLSISFGRTGITVSRPPGSDVPPGICLSETLTGSGIEGPAGTTLDMLGVGLDMTTRTPYGLYGFLVVVFDLPDFSGACEVPFNIEFTIP
ncbi:MAG: hypothetical protein HY791_24090 [Deltaproteobacteria bacterium]|nr:hypothetical protein [Deltaproteobacteria bacterium]